MQNVAKLREDLNKNFASESARLNEEHVSKIAQLKSELHCKYSNESAEAQKQHDERIKGISAQNERDLAQLKDKLANDKV